MTPTIKVINLDEEARYLQEQQDQPEFMQDTQVRIGQGTLLHNTYTEGNLKQIQKDYFNHISHLISTDEGREVLAAINRLAREAKAGTSLALLTGQPASSCHGMVVQHLVTQAINRLPLVAPETTPAAEPVEMPMVNERVTQVTLKETTTAEANSEVEPGPQMPADPTTEDELEGAEPNDPLEPTETESGDSGGEDDALNGPSSAAEEEPGDETAPVEEPQDDTPVPSQFFQQLAALLKPGQTALMMVKHEADGDLSVTFGPQVDESNPQAQASPSVFIKLAAAELDDPETGFLKGLEAYRQERKTALASFKAASSNIKAPAVTASKASKTQPVKKGTPGKSADSKPAESKTQDTKPASQGAAEPQSQSPLFAVAS